MVRNKYRKSIITKYPISQALVYQNFNESIDLFSSRKILIKM